MGDERYYRDAPRFDRRDPLTTWSIVFLVMGAGAVAWMLFVFFLTAGDFVGGAPDSAFGLTVNAWVIITALLLGASIVGLLFTILARLGTTEGGRYLSTLESSTASRASPARAREPEADSRQGTTVQPAPRSPPNPPEGGGEALPAAQSVQSAQVLSREAARIETTNGPDGRVLLSYTVPEDQPRGLYGDTYVPVDSDAVLNIKTLLAKTPTA